VEKMALLVFLALGIAVGKTKCAICAVGFYNEAQRFACMCSSGLEALSCPFSTKYFRSTDLRLTTSPAIATYTLLPPVLLCLPWFVGLFVAVIFIVFCRAVGAAILSRPKKSLQFNIIILL